MYNRGVLPVKFQFMSQDWANVKLFFQSFVIIFKRIVVFNIVSIYRVKSKV